VTTTLSNTGARPGADVIQVYARRQVSDAPSRLVGFARVEVAAGDSLLVQIPVPLERLAVRDTTNHTMTVVPGTYMVRVARHACDPVVELAVVIGTPPDQ
jgi:beta-glucosidase